MYTKSKKALCVFMAVLCLAFCILPGLTPKAEAATPIAIAVGAAAAWVLGMMGIQFASMQAANDAAGAFYNSSPTVSADLETVASTFLVTDLTTKLPITAAILPVVLRLIAAAKEFFGADTSSIPVINSDYGLVGDIRYTKQDISKLNIVTDSKTIFGLCTYSDIGEQASIKLNGESMEYSVDTSSNNSYIYFKCNDNICSIGYQKQFHFEHSLRNGVTSLGFTSVSNAVKTSLEIKNIDFRYGFYNGNIGGISYLLPFAAACVVTADGVKQYFAAKSGDTFYELYHNGWLNVSAENLSDITDNVAYNLMNINIAALTAAIEGLKDSIGDIALDISDLYNSLTDTAEGAQEGEQDQTVPYIPSLEWLKKMLRDMGVTADLINKITAGATETENPAGSITLDEVDPDIPQLPDLRDKFPFCVPFDLIGCFQALNAEPEPPRFVVPLVFEPLNFSYDIVVDFAPFERIAVVCRWVCTFSFIVFLALVTRKIIQA